MKWFQRTHPVEEKPAVSDTIIKTLEEELREWKLEERRENSYFKLFLDKKLKDWELDRSAYRRLVDELEFVRESLYFVYITRIDTSDKRHPTQQVKERKEHYLARKKAFGKLAEKLLNTID